MKVRALAPVARSPFGNAVHALPSSIHTFETTAPLSLRQRSARRSFLQGFTLTRLASDYLAEWSATYSRRSGCLT
ncbi:hypothetical protein Deipe_3313 [Deinococcus peraridilitoris DSM 19664]|uniref:Uncharacterized protein n=1 Tax=Deinococcus peraridilitoris (strain DSM 19664 / LMG 22246 / CIP 109416 / KR-200) TaxID=937777 RepID=L0A4E2_DEIPD|nr:hypothetical protein Deipe_3313 [Deinococcus peraridilitoris DSM 19664]